MIKTNYDFFNKPKPGDRAICDVLGVHHIIQIISITEASYGDSFVEFVTLQTNEFMDIPVGSINFKSMILMINTYSKIQYTSYNQIWIEVCH